MWAFAVLHLQGKMHVIQQNTEAESVMAFTSIAAERAADLASFCIYHFLFYCILDSYAAQGHAAVLPGSYGTTNA